MTAQRPLLFIDTLMPSRRAYRRMFGSEQALLPAIRSRHSRVLGDLPFSPPSFTLLSWTFGRGTVVRVYRHHDFEGRSQAHFLTVLENLARRCPPQSFLCWFVRHMEVPTCPKLTSAICS